MDRGERQREERGRGREWREVERGSLERGSVERRRVEGSDRGNKSNLTQSARFTTVKCLHAAKDRRVWSVSRGQSTMYRC